MYSYKDFLKKEKSIKQAVALGYDSSKDLAPKVLAKGSNNLAEKIIKVARDNNIVIKEDPDLVKILSIVEVNDYIPKEVYSLVAKILAYIYSRKGDK